MRLRRWFGLPIHAVIIALAIGAAACSLANGRSRQPDFAACSDQWTVGDLVITEVMANPPNRDVSKEYFEAYNASGRDLDLAGLELAFQRRDGGKPKRFVLTEGNAAAGEFVVFGGAMAELAPEYVNYGYGGAFALAKSGGLLRLSCGGVDIDDARYPAMSKPGVAFGTDGTRPPDPVANDDPASFCAATSQFGVGLFGTPGRANDPCGPALAGQCSEGSARRAIVHPHRGDLVITEVMPNPRATSDANGEWVELFATADVDLNGVIVSRTAGASVKNTTLLSPFCIAVRRGEFVLLARNDDSTKNGGLPAVRARLGQLSLLHRKGDLFLDSDGERLDEIGWAASVPGASLALDPGKIDPVANDDAKNWSVCRAVYGTGDRGTPGADNSSCSR
jgi:hypothetical protein